MNKKCEKCKQLKENYNRIEKKYEQLKEWNKEHQKIKEELRQKIEELKIEHKRLVDKYFR